MKYLPAINVWAAGVQEAILSGALKLQSGQCILCGDTKSVFDRVTSNGVIIAYHGATYGEARAKYFRVRKASRELEQRKEKRRAIRLEFERLLKEQGPGASLQLDWVNPAGF